MLQNLFTVNAHLRLGQQILWNLLTTDYVHIALCYENVIILVK